VSISEPFRVSYMIGATTFPFLAVLSNLDGSVELVDRIDGPIGAEDLMARLTNVMENQGPALVAARSTNEERDLNRLIMQEQDLAYRESLQADQEKDERAQEEERRRKEEEQRIIDEERRLREEQESVTNRRRNELERKRTRLSTEPREGEPNTCDLAIRLPDGSRLKRRFYLSDTLRDIYDYVDICEPAGLEIGSYDLVSNYPRKAYVESDATIESTGLGTQALLFIQVN